MTNVKLLQDANNLSDVASPAAAYNNISPMTTAGDMEFETSAGVASRLSIGTPGQLLMVSAGFRPTWGEPPMFAPTGLTGAVGASRYVGANAGIPASGSFNTGDFILDTSINAFRICSAGGSPGTWNAICAVSGSAPVALGTAASGSGVTVSRQDHVHPATGWLPSDQGMIDAISDIYAAPNTSILIGGTLYLVKFTPRSSYTISNLWFAVTAVGNDTGGTGNNFVGLINSSGTLLSGSANVSTRFTATGAAICPLTTPQAVTAGASYWGAILVNFGTTQPTLARGNGTPVATNLNLSPSGFRFATNGTGLSAIPASITPGSNSGTGISLWMGWS